MNFKTEMDFLLESIASYSFTTPLTVSHMVIAIQAAKSAYNDYLQERLDDRLNNLGEDN